MACTGCIAEKKVLPKRSYTVGVVLKSMDSEHWLAVRSGLQAAAQQYNVDLVVLSAERETAAEEQRKIIFDLLNSHIDALVVSPCDVYQSADYAAIAKRKGIPFFTMDEMIESVSYIGSDNFQIGVTAAGQLQQILPDTVCETAIIMGNQQQNAHLKRAAGFREGISERVGWKVVAEEIADSDFAAAYGKTKQIIKEHPQVHGLFVTSAVMGLGAIEALEEMGLEHTVHLIGVDKQDDLILAVQQRKADVIISQDGYAEGILAIQTVVKALNGEPYDNPAYIENHLITRENAADYMQQ